MQEKLVMLIVDDVAVNRASLRNIFEQEYNIVEAENGQTALEILKNRKIDMVILDMCMPVMDGAGVLGRMKADWELRDIPVVIKTSVDEHMEAAMLEKGADDFIVSPFDPAVIRSRVRNLSEKYISEKLWLQREIEEGHHVSRVREKLIDRIAAEIKKDAGEILAVCGRQMACEMNTENEAFKEILARTNHLLKMVDGTLVNSGFEQETYRRDVATFRVQDIAAEIEKEYRGLCRGREIDFQMEVCGEAGANLAGNSGYARQIWARMLDKAYCCTSAGGCIKTVCVLRRKEGRQVQLEITVHGKGDPDDGYPVVRSIAELLHGTVGVKPSNEMGQVTVTAILPFYLGKEPVGQKRRLDQICAILLDDDELIRDYDVSILTRLGVSCETAANSVDATARLWRAYMEGGGYDICFVNWDMEGGEIFIRDIRDSYPPEAMLIVCFGNEDEQRKREMIEAGVDYILERPAYQSTIYRFLAQICNSGNQDASGV